MFALSSQKAKDAEPMFITLRCKFLTQIYGRSWLFTCDVIAVPNVLERFF